MEAKFSIFAHILDHDEVTFKVEEKKLEVLQEDERNSFIEKKYDRSRIENFIISFDPIQFSSKEEMKQKIENYLSELVKDNCTRTQIQKKINKHGVEKLYEYERLGTFNNSLISIHLNTDNPHVHLVFDKKSKDKDFGKRYSSLTNAIQKLNSILNIVTTDSKEREVLDRTEKNFEKAFELKNLEQELTKFSWALEKNKNMNTFHTKNVSINNIGEALQKYVSLNGSFSFAEGIASKLKEKNFLEQSIILEKTKEHKYISSLIEKENYGRLTDKLIQDCKLAKPMNIEIRNFIKESSRNQFEVDLKESFVDLYTKSNYQYNKETKTKFVDINKMTPVIHELERQISTFEKERLIEIENTVFYQEKELKKAISSINISQSSFEELKEKSISKIIFENNYQYLLDNFYGQSMEEVIDFLKDFNEELSDNYIETIANKFIEDKELDFSFDLDL